MNREHDEPDRARTIEPTREFNGQAWGIAQDTLSGTGRFISAAIEKTIRSLEERRFDAIKMPPTGCRNLLPDLIERLDKDVAIYQSIEGLKPERWKTADFLGRMQTLLDMENQIAADQGRSAFLVVAQTKRLMPATNILATNVLASTSHPVGEKELNGPSPSQSQSEDRLRVILIQKKTVMNESLKNVFTYMAKEIFNAFQHDVLERPSAYSLQQVSLQRRAYWAWGDENKARLSLKDQPFEIDAKIAVDYARVRLFR